MTDAAQTIFPDTNFFLHFKKASEIKWAEITNALEIRLVVCRQVQRELDALKGNGNARRADRARAASALLRRIVTNDAPVTLREKGPRVTLHLAPRISRDYPHPNSLDTSRGDDQLVAEMLAYHAITRVPVALLTDDTGVMATARDEQLEFIPTPDSWRLPAEADSRDKEILQLRNQVSRLLLLSPTLDLSVGFGSADVGPSLTLEDVSYESLSDDYIVDESFKIAGRLPCQRSFEEKPPNHAGLEQGVTVWKAPSAQEITTYEENYRNWFSSIEDILINLHETLSMAQPKSPIILKISNAGSISAKGFTLDVEALGPMLLSDRSAVTQKHKNLRLPKLPRPPTPPRWRASHDLNSFGGRVNAAAQMMMRVHPHSLASSGSARIPSPFGEQVKERDPRSFRWSAGIEARIKARRLRADCDELRHGADAEVFELLVVALDAGGQDRCALRIQLSASNCPDRVERIIPIHFTERVGDTVAIADGLINDLLRDAVLRKP